MVRTTCWASGRLANPGGKRGIDDGQVDLDGLWMCSICFAVKIDRLYFDVHTLAMRVKPKSSGDRHRMSSGDREVGNWESRGRG